MYFIFSILNKNIITNKKQVIFGDSMLKEKDELADIISKTDMPDIKKDEENAKKEGESLP